MVQRTSVRKKSSPQISDILSKEDVNDHYNLGNKIGSGHFSIVKLATDKKTSKMVAIKIISVTDMQKRNKEMLHQEILILTSIRVILIKKNPANGKKT